MDGWGARPLRWLSVLVAFGESKNRPKSIGWDSCSLCVDEKRGKKIVLSHSQSDSFAFHSSFSLNFPTFCFPSFFISLCFLFGCISLFSLSGLPFLFNFSFLYFFLFWGPWDFLLTCNFWPLFLLCFQHFLFFSAFKVALVQIICEEVNVKSHLVILPVILKHSGISVSKYWLKSLLPSSRHLNGYQRA